jgi:hypothetical protein
MLSIIAAHALGSVMGAVDAKAAGAGLDQLIDKGAVGGALWRDGHHDAGVALAGIVAEKPCLVAGDLRQSGVQCRRLGPGRRQAGQPVQRGTDSSQGLAEMGFRASQR